MRFVTLDDYDGTAWRAGNRTVADAEDDLFQRIGSEVAAPLPGEDVEVNVEMRGAYTGAWLPLVGQLTGIEFDFADGRAQREDVRYNPATSSATVVGGLGPDDDYTFTASVPVTKLAKNSQAYATDGPLEPQGTALDDYLAPYRDSGRDELTQVLLLARYLKQNGRYSDGAGALVVPPGHDIDRLTGQFIGAERIVGNDEQYAAFMALAANRLGVPARVVVGTFTPEDGKVQGRDVQAWVELRVRDGSWRILPTSTFMSNRRPSADDEPPQSLEEFVQDQLPEDDTDNPDSPEQVPLPDPDADLEGDDPGAEESALPGGGAPLGLLALALVSQVIPLLKLARRLVRRQRRRTSSRVVGAWRELVDLGMDLRVPVADGATREAQAAALGVDPVLAQHADDLIFAMTEPTSEDAAEYWRAVEQARRALAKRHSLRQQVFAFYNPASLVAQLRRRARVLVATPEADAGPAPRSSARRRRQRLMDHEPQRVRVERRAVTRASRGRPTARTGTATPTSTRPPTASSSATSGSSGGRRASPRPRRACSGRSRTGTCSRSAPARDSARAGSGRRAVAATGWTSRSASCSTAGGSTTRPAWPSRPSSARPRRCRSPTTRSTWSSPPSAPCSSSATSTWRCARSRACSAPAAGSRSRSPTRPGGPSPTTRGRAA